MGQYSSLQTSNIKSYKFKFPYMCAYPYYQEYWETGIKSPMLVFL